MRGRTEESMRTSQSAIHDLHSHCHELPASMADRGTGTACADIVVICQVNIKNKLALFRVKHFFLHRRVLGSLHIGKSRQARSLPGRVDHHRRTGSVYTAPMSIL